MILLVFLSALIAADLFFRRRQHAALEAEHDRLRSRIAANLHDDLGPSLSQISLLSQLASRQAGADSEIAEILDEIGEVCRTLTGSVNDTICSMSRNVHDPAGTIESMRRFAGDLLRSTGVSFHFRIDTRITEGRLNAGNCRQVLLIFKESLNNIVRHADCSEVKIDLAIEHDCLVMRIADNGRGFDPQNVRQGCGLANMRRRAQHLGGEFRIASSDRGTMVTVAVPSGRESTGQAAAPAAWLSILGRLTSLGRSEICQ